MVDHSNAVEIFTYGGGQGLFQVFNAIATLAHPKNGLIVSFGWLAVIMGAFWSVIHLFFAPKFEVIFMRFAFPACLIWITCVSSTTPVVIRDVLAQSDHKVDHVPYLFASFANLGSHLGYILTKALEDVLHKPNDPQYQQAGLIFGAQTALDFAKYRLTNADLEDNLNRFCKKCVLYDLQLGKYSVDELRKTSDIWGFLTKNTSKTRLVEYCKQDKEAKFKAIRAQLMTCQNAIASMSEDFAKEKSHYQGIDFAKQLPLTFQALTKLQTANKDLISQQLMMNVLTNNFPKRFAQERAKSYLNETSLMMGLSFQTGIISLRVLLESILYLSIIVVIPLSFLPDGFSKIKNWALMYLWIQMWPPFFVIINFIFQTYAQHDASQIFAGLSEAQQGLSLYTSVGATELYRDVLAKCGFAYTLVPILSYVFIKGGEMSFVSLASSLVQPEQTAASTATNEMLSGNYSFGNVQYSQKQYENMTAFQNSLAPSVSDEYFFTNDGGLSQTFMSNDKRVLRENLSELSSSLSFESSVGNHWHQSKQVAKSQLETEQKAYQENIAETTRDFCDFTQHLANNDSYSINSSSREAHSAHEAATELWNDAEQFAANHNVSSSDVIKGMLGFKVLGGSGMESGMETSHADLNNQLKSYASSDDFQQRMDKINEYSRVVSHTGAKDEGDRKAISYCESLDKMRSSQESWSNAHHKLIQASETADRFDQNSFFHRENLTPEFIAFTQQKCEERKYPWTVAEIVTGHNKLLLDDLIEEFAPTYTEKIPAKIPNNYVEPKEKYDQTYIQQLDYDQLKVKFNEEHALPQDQLAHEKNDLETKKQAFDAKVEKTILNKEEKTYQGYIDAEKQFKNEESKYLVQRFGGNMVEKVKDTGGMIADTYHALAHGRMPADPLDPDPEIGPDFGNKQSNRDHNNKIK